MAEEESIVLRPREPFSDALLPQSTDELAKFMDQPTMAIAEMITGALAAGPKAWTLMTGHIVQGILKGKLLTQLCQEIKELRDRGKIADDFADEKHKYGFKSWVELLTVIDEETPDADRLKALKAMFYGVNRVNATDAEKILSYRLFQIAKKLNSSELLLLKTVWEAFRKGFTGEGHRNLPVWAEKIAKLQGHNLMALVMKDQCALMEQQLISGYRNTTVSIYEQVVDDRDARLTDLGIVFCKNIEIYELETSAFGEQQT